MAPISLYQRIPGSARNYRNILSGQIISRRQYDQNFGRLANTPYRTYEQQAKANQYKRPVQRSKRFGERVSKGSKNQHQVTIFEPTPQDLFSTSFYYRLIEVLNDKRRKWKRKNYREITFWLIKPDYLSENRKVVRGVVILLQHVNLFDMGRYLARSVETFGLKIKRALLMISLIMERTEGYFIVSPLPQAMAYDAGLYFEQVIKISADYRESASLQGAIFQVRSPL